MRLNARLAGWIGLTLLLAAVWHWLGTPRTAGLGSGGIGIFIQTMQRSLHERLVDAMDAVGNEGLAAGWALIGVSLLYGVFHAAGPGHGKMVLSTYLTTHGVAMRRGILLSVVSSLCQGLTAIVLVEGAAALLGWSARATERAGTVVEGVSFACVAALGAMLAAEGAARLWRRRRPAFRPPFLHEIGPTHEGHAHDDACGCGHAHGPGRDQLDAPVSLRGMLGVILSIGIRPCSGAVLILVVARSLDLRWAGIAAVMAMAAGTAATVSALALLAVHGRGLAIRLAAGRPSGARWLGPALDALRVAGGLAIAATGLLLLQATAVTPPHPLL